LKNILKSDVDVVALNYVLATEEKGNPTFHYRQPRLVKKAKKYKWIGPVHGYLEVYRNTLNTNFSIHHKKQ
jgi:hypothetical protein